MKAFYPLLILSVFFSEIAFSQNIKNESFNSVRSDFWEVINTPDSVKIKAIGFDNNNNII